jgi:DNA-binding FrmR family transcriptional regulator
MKTVDQRLSNIEGQIGGVRKMIKDNKDCVKVLTQLKAIKSAVLIKIKKYVKNN